MRHTGSCLCGKMKYETGNLSKEIIHCHCTFCKKHHGAPFATHVVFVDPITFEWTSGGNDVGRFQSSSHSARLFCKVCGSSLVAEIDGGKLLSVTPSTLDNELDVKEVFHIFANSKETWYSIPVTETSFDTYPPSFSQFIPTDLETVRQGKRLMAKRPLPESGDNT